MKLRAFFFAILMSLVLGFASQAYAGLLGSSVTTQYYAYGGAYNGLGSPDSFVANGNIQNQFEDFYTLIVADTMIEYDFLKDVTWSGSEVSLDSENLFITNGNLLSFTGAPAITEVTFNSSSTVVPGFSLADITFNSSKIAVDWQKITFHRGDRVILDVNVTPVPEPETYLMLLAGLGLIIFIRRVNSNEGTARIPS